MGDKRDWEDRHALLDALKAWPALPPPLALAVLSEAADFNEDWGRGKKIQNELGLEAIPPKCEYETGAGLWDRITNGAWRDHYPSKIVRSEENGS